jgi:hypothetical protein
MKKGFILSIEEIMQRVAEQPLELNNIFKTLDTSLISIELEGLWGRKIKSPDFILSLSSLRNIPWSSVP